MDRKGTILRGWLFLVFSACAWANPVSFGSKIGTGVVIALAYEAFLLGCLFGRINFRVLYLSTVWLGITYLTYLAFRYVFGSLYEIADSIYPIWIGELAVILTEAKLIQWLSRLSFLDFNDTGRPLRFIKALGYSTLINIGSIIAGFLLR